MAGLHLLVSKYVSCLAMHLAKTFVPNFFTFSCISTLRKIDHGGLHHVIHSFSSVACIPNMPDTRRIIGGDVWARADAVSRDARRIYVSKVSNIWLQGIVMEVMCQRKNVMSKRSTTYVKAVYRCGNTQKTTILPLQVLKDKDPTRAAPTVIAENNNTNIDNTINDNNENLVPPPAPANGDQEVQEPININPASSNNGCNWYEGIADVDVNGPVPFRSWRMTCQYSGRVFTQNCDTQDHNIKCELSPFDLFMASFPKEQLKFMLEQTTASLQMAGKSPTSIGEILKWFGVTLLMTRFEFGGRHTLWSENNGSKYVPSANIGTRTGMSRECYDQLQQHISWSFQLSQRPEGMSSESHRWMLVDGFVQRFNDHRKKHFMPGSTYVFKRGGGRLIQLRMLLLSLLRLLSHSQQLAISITLPVEELISIIGCDKPLLC